MPEFKDKVVLITGAASGMGRALSFRMGREGATIAMVDRNPEGLEKVRKDAMDAGIKCATAVANVRNRSEVQTAVANLVGQVGPVDAVIPCAGLAGVSTCDDLKVELVEEIVGVNFLGVIYTIDAVLPKMLERKQGHIIGMASLSAFRAIPFESAYCASKSALVFYLESLRPALRGRGVLVTTVFPGFVQTPLLAHLLEESGAKPPPGQITAEYAADRIVQSAKRGARISAFPWSTLWLARISSWLPYGIYDRVMRRIAAGVPLRY
jgi:short-subunit dehydrogenase